jgi:hypothetical protein
VEAVDRGLAVAGTRKTEERRAAAAAGEAAAGVPRLCRREVKDWGGGACHRSTTVVVLPDTD